MYPTVYLYHKTEKGHQLYLGEYTTYKGVTLLDNNLEIESITMVTTNNKDYEYAIAKGYPNFKTVQELAFFLQQTEAVDFLKFKVTFKNFCQLTTHDNGECHFTFGNKKNLIQILEKAIPEQYKLKVIHTVLENPNQYITINKNGTLKLFKTFNQYLKEN